MSKITDFFKRIISDLKDEPTGETLEEKNAYRTKIAILMAVVALALFFVLPFPLSLVAVVPAAVGVWKVKIILTDKS